MRLAVPLSLVLGLLPSLAWAADDPAALAVEAARSGRFDEAVARSEEAVKARPKDAAVWNVRAYTLSAAGRKAEAVEAYAQASALDPKDVLSQMNRGSVLLALGRPTEALLAFDQALALDPRRARLYNHRGVALERLGRLDDARRSYRTAIRLAPKDPIPHNNLGALAYRRGVEGGAAALFAKALELDPRFEAASFNATLVVARTTGQSTKAEDEILASAARADAPPRVKARAKGVLAGRAAKAGRLPDAKQLYLEQLELDPTDASALNDLGVLEDQAGEAREALAHFLMAIDLRPSDPNVLNNVGVVHVHRGDLAAAEVSFRDVLRLEPFFHRAWHNLGVVLGAKGDRNGAVAAFRRAAELQPADASAVYNLTILAREMGSDRASERAGYERALKVDADLTEAHLSLGTLLADPATPSGLRDEASARSHLRRFLELAFADDVTGRKQAQDWLSWLDRAAAARAAADRATPPR